jgi:hypothetical protein
MHSPRSNLTSSRLTRQTQDKKIQISRTTSSLFLLTEAQDTVRFRFSRFGRRKNGDPFRSGGGGGAALAFGTQSKAAASRNTASQAAL